MRLGLAEMRRERSRFAFVTAALALLVMLVLLLSALSDGLFRTNTGAIRTSDATAYAFSSDAEGSFVRSRLPASDVDRLAAAGGVADAAPVGVLLTGATGPDGGLDVALFGHRPGGVGAPQGLAAGRFPDPGEDGAAVGSSSLRESGVTLGSTMRIGDVPVRVVGFVDDAEYQGQPTLWSTIATWEQARQAVRPETRGETDVVTAVALRLADGVTVAEVAAPTGVSVLSREDSYLAIPGVAQQESTFASIINTTYLVAGIVVALFFALLTLEKRSLLAALKAIGASTRRLAGVLFSQAVATSVVALVAGGVLAWLLGQLVPDQVPVVFLPETFVGVALATLVAALLGAVLSLRRIARIDPATALGGTL